MAVYIFRLSHRPARDKRITTHCALVARAMGAKGFYYSGQKDPNLEKSVKGVVRQWGGEFFIEYVPKWQPFFKQWKGKIAHLTVYGMPLEKKIKAMRNKGDILLVVGGEKVPSEVYKQSDWNISVTSQPHSEVAAIALFLDRYYHKKALDMQFPGAKLKVVPQERGKKVIKA